MQTSIGLSKLILNMIGYANGGRQLLHNLIGVYNILSMTRYTRVRLCGHYWTIVNRFTM